MFCDFGPFRVDTQRFLLLKEGEPTAIPPKVFETLLFLVQNRGRTVKKDELISSIWPDSFVEESNLAQNVFVLRKILGDERKYPRYIVTIPGTGYRFVAPVRQITEEDYGSEHTDADKTRAPPEGEPVLSIAVLPFRSLAPEEHDSFLGIGLADALVTRLSSLKQVRVRPTTSVLRYRDMKDDPLSVGREMNVDSLLAGVFQREGDQIRVSVQFVRVGDGATLWAAHFDECFTNIFSIQDSISEQVVRALALELSGEERRQLKKNYTDSTDAFQLFIKGRYFWNQRTVEGLLKAIEFAQQALTIDPTYAPAYVGLADSYNLLAGHGGRAPRDTFPRAKAAALRALEIDEALPEAYASMGFLNYRFEWDWSEAEANFLRAIELKPNYPTAHHWYGESLAATERFEESLIALSRSQEFDPLSLPINTDLAQTLFFARRFEECEAQLRKTLEMDRDFIRAHIILGAALAQMHRFKEAAAALKKAVKLSGGNPFAVSGLGCVYALWGNEEKARQTLEELNRLSPHVAGYNSAVIYTALGEIEAALSRLEQAVDHKDVWLVWLKVDPRLDPLRKHRRFLKLLQSVGLQP